MRSTAHGRADRASRTTARWPAVCGTRFIQLFDWGWDSQGAAEGEALNGGFVRKCQSVDQATYGLITDLKQRGMLDDTLIQEAYCGALQACPLFRGVSWLPSGVSWLL